MTQKDHLELYDEIKPVLNDRSVGYQNMTQAQRYFVQAFEIACFEDCFLASYARLVDQRPAISVRNLHAFCLGWGLGRSMDLALKTENDTSH